MRRLLPLLLLIGACTGGAGDDERPAVAASGYGLQWLVGQVGGDGVRVVDGGDPHGPATVDGADLLVLLPGQAGPDDAEVLDLSLAVGVRPPVSDLGDEDGDADPHVWLDPVRAQAAAIALGERLEPLARGSVDRAEQTSVALGALHARYTDGLAGCERRTLVASHTAFAALAERYDLRHAGVAGLSPDDAPAAGRSEEVLRLAREEATTTVFLAPGEDAAAAVDALGAGTLPLDPLEQEPADGDYLAVADRNLQSLREGLGCA